MRRRFAAGDDPIPDRGELMGERRRASAARRGGRGAAEGAGTDGAFFNDHRGRAAAAAANNGGDSSGIMRRRGASSSPPRPEHRRGETTGRYGYDDNDDDSRSALLFERIFLTAAPPFIRPYATWFLDSTRPIMRISRSVWTAVSRRSGALFLHVRRQYRRASRKPTSILNKALFLLGSPFAAVRWAVLGEPMVHAMVAGGSVSPEGLASSPKRIVDGCGPANAAKAFDASEMRQLATQRAARATNGIRLHAFSSSPSPSSSTYPSSSSSFGNTSAPSAPAWWDSDVVVVTAPLGVLQRSIGGGVRRSPLAAPTPRSSGNEDSFASLASTTTSVGRNTPRATPSPSAANNPKRGGSSLRSDDEEERDAAAGAITFFPPLPLRKREAIAATGCSATLKIALQFRVADAAANNNSNAAEAADDELFWPADVEFFGLVAPKANTDTKPASESRLIDSLMMAPLDVSSEGAATNRDDDEGTQPHAYPLGDAGHIEIVNLHRLRGGGGVLILEVENDMARRWSAFANQTRLVESEVMPALRSAFCPSSSFSSSSASSATTRCKVPPMPRWFAVNNYLKNPHIRCGFSYWRPGRDGRDNLLLRAGLWPDGHAAAEGLGARNGAASALFSALVPSLQHHHVNLRKYLTGPTTTAAGLILGAAPPTDSSTSSLSGATASTSAGLPSSALSVPGRNRLLFAGEHTSPDLYGNMHGAVVEGQRAALETTALIEAKVAAFEEAHRAASAFWRQTTVGRLLRLLADAVWSLLFAGSVNGVNAALPRGAELI